MRLEKLFFTPVWSDSLQLSEEHLDVSLKKCLDLQQTLPSVQKSNLKGWQSKVFMPGKDNIPLEFHEILVAVRSRLDKVAQQLQMIGRFEVDAIWVNVNFKGDLNVLHMHPDCSLSGCVYLTENNSALTFTDNSILNFWLQGLKSVRSTQYNVQPARGDIIIFPSWLVHGVQPNDEDQPRVSISFNAQHIIDD